MRQFDIVTRYIERVFIVREREVRIAAGSLEDAKRIANTHGSLIPASVCHVLKDSTTRLTTEASDTIVSVEESKR